MPDRSLHLGLQCFRDALADCHNDTRLVNINTANSCDLIRRPSHDVGGFLIGHIGQDQLGAKSAPDIVQMLPLLLTRFGVGVDDVGGVADAIEAAAKSVAGPGLSVTVDQHGIVVMTPCSRSKLGKQLGKLGNARDRRVASLASPDLQSLLLDRVFANLIPGQSHEILPPEPRQRRNPRGIVEGHVTITKTLTE